MGLSATTIWMVEQLGVAVMPVCDARCAALTSGTTSGTPGSMRNTLDLSIAVALKPIYDAAGIERVVVSTYQAVSGSGQGGIAALDAQARQWAAGEPVEQQFY